MANPKPVGQITVATRGGAVTVDAYVLTDNLAVHEPLDIVMARQDGESFRIGEEGWMLSHRHTGYSAIWVETLAEARKAIKELDRPELRWDFTTPLGSVVLPGCCARLAGGYRIRQRATGAPIPSGRFRGHRLHGAS